MINLDEVSRKMTLATAEWMLSKPNGAEFSKLEASFDHLLQSLIKTCTWAVTGVKTGDTKIFFPHLRSGLPTDKIKYSQLIQDLGSMGNIFTTTDYCLPLQRQNAILLIWVCELDNHSCQLDNSFWNVCVFEMVNRIRNLEGTFKPLLDNLIAAINEKKGKERECLEEIKTRLLQIPCAVVYPKEGIGYDNELVKQFLSIEFKLYILIITFLDDDWTRVAMLPTISPPGHLHHPGGLVICENEKIERTILSSTQLKELQRVASIPFWPWMLTARTSERGQDSNLSLKLKDFFTAMSNDYRSMEYLFGGAEYTLTDNHNFKIALDPNTANSSEETANEIPIIGLQAFIKRANNILNTKINKSDAFTGSISHKLDLTSDLDQDQKKSLLESFKKLAEDAAKEMPKKKQGITGREEKQIKRNKERAQKIANVEHSLADSASFNCNISIIIPVDPTEDRIRNLLICLEGFDAQTAIRKFSNIFELIILLDTNDNGTSDSIIRVNQIRKAILGLSYLKKVDYKVFYSKDVDKIGRSSIRNYGLSQSRGNVIQLLDDSMLLQKDYFMEVLLRFEHLRGQKFALVGFKERINCSEQLLRLIQELMTDGFFLPDARDDFKRNERVKESFSYAFKHYKNLEPVDYMELTGDLCFLSGSVMLGTRTLNQFFSTGLVAFWKDEVIAVGGFHSRFNKDWGMEDGHMGMLLVANGNKIIPCYSALALDLKHEKAVEKDQHKAGYVKVNNKSVEEELISKTLSYYNRNMFDDDIKRIAKLFSGPYSKNKRPGKLKKNR